jgi:hypothetical protein
MCDMCWQLSCFNNMKGCVAERLLFNPITTCLPLYRSCSTASYMP